MENQTETLLFRAIINHKAIVTASEQSQRPLTQKTPGKWGNKPKRGQVGWDKVQEKGGKVRNSEGCRGKGHRCPKTTSVVFL